METLLKIKPIILNHAVKFEIQIVVYLTYTLRTESEIIGRFENAKCPIRLDFNYEKKNYIISLSW